MLRQNSKLRRRLSPEGYDFLQSSVGAIGRLLPHTETSGWKELEESRNGKSGATWKSIDRRQISVRVCIRSVSSSESRVISSDVARRLTNNRTGAGALRTLDAREHDICGRIATLLGSTLQMDAPSRGGRTLIALRRTFDESVVADHLSSHHKLDVDLSEILHAIHHLSEQTYENKGISFGVVLDPKARASRTAPYLSDLLLETKKYRALSDGFRTAYRVSADGRICSLIDLDAFSKSNSNSHGHAYYPEWSRLMATVSRNGRCGIVLTKSGDLLVFDEGALRFTRRFGAWHYWNHAHLVELLKNRARVQKVDRKLIGSVVSTLYRAALDVSFRRTGALFVMLKNRDSIGQLVRMGDAISDKTRSSNDEDFDSSLAKKSMIYLPRTIVSEIASLDGAVVLSNSGSLLAYGAVLNPRKKGRLDGAEGSRTKAAIGASKYGLAIKVSSDGDITVYSGGKKFIRI